MHPSCFVLVSLPEEGINDSHVIFRAEGQEQQAIAIHFPHAVWA